MPFDLIDTSEWPLVYVEILNAPEKVEEIDMFQAKFTALLQLAHTGAPGISPEKICIIMNLDGIMHASFEHKIRAAGFIKDVREYVNSSIYCTALVIQNETVRMILEFILSIQPLQSLNKLFTTKDEALTWSRKNRALQLQEKPPEYDC
jgi:hypothetical protein